MSRVLRFSCAAAAVLLTSMLPAAPAGAQGLDETCLLPLTKFDPATINVAFPDDSALYYGASFVLAPGMRVRITGRFPHARYMSFNAYDAALRPVDSINDVHIQPDKGSANPFLTGADRTGSRRSYTVFIESGPKPDKPAPNTIYPGVAADGTPNPAHLFLYRIYVPDKGTGETGGVGVPTATIEPDSATATPDPSPCTNVTKPSVSGINELLAQQATPSGVATPGGVNPPLWRKFVNLASSVALNVTGDPNPGGVPLDDLFGTGGFLSNRDNQYVSAVITRGLGDVLVTRMRVATFPDTRPGTPAMPRGQLRYWSLCQNDPITQRFIACVNDDRAAVTSDGWATFVVSPAALRPKDATAACGVNWMPWGGNPRGVLIYRNMLPDPGFAQAIQFAKVDHERETMGDYFPVSTYYADGATYEKAVGCHPIVPATTGSSGPAAAPKPTTCRTARTLHIRLSVRARHVRVRVGTRRTQVVAVRHGRLTLRLARVPRGRFTVRVTSGGRTLARRTFRFC